MLHGLTAPLVDTLGEHDLDGVGLFGKSGLEIGSADLEDWEIDQIVRNVEDFELS